STLFPYTTLFRSELARMARHRPAIREDHGPRDIGLPPEQLAIDEIGDAPEEQSDRDRLGDDVGESENRSPTGAREQNDRDRDAERAAVKRHPAMPQIQR